MVIRGRGGLPPSSLLPGGLEASWGDTGWQDFLKEDSGLASFISLGSSGGAGGGGTQEGKGGGGGSTGAGASRSGLRAAGGGGKQGSGGEPKGERTSGGGGGNRGDRGSGGPSGESARGGGGGRKGDLSAAAPGEDGEGREGPARRAAGAESSLLTVPPPPPPTPSVDVLEERDVDDEEMETEDTREDFLSGTLGLGFPLPLAGDRGFRNTGTGVSAVGVLDWLE